MITLQMDTTVRMMDMIAQVEEIIDIPDPADVE
jgi:hypothetical protein